jgi:hypothetical protein
LPVENLLKRFIEAARKSRADGFVNEHAGFYLLGKVVYDPKKRAMGFHTGVRDSREMEALMDDEASPDEPGMRSGFFLLKVEKSDRNPWSSWVSVGRARNNDVVLRHLSVSKMHAQFFVRPGADGNADYMIADAKSAKGTFVNGRKQGSSDPTPVKSGDQVRFGEINCEFLDAGDLYKKLLAVPDPMTPPEDPWDDF